MAIRSNHVYIEYITRGYNGYRLKDGSTYLLLVDPTLRKDGQGGGEGGEGSLAVMAEEGEGEGA